MPGSCTGLLARQGLGWLLSYTLRRKCVPDKASQCTVPMNRPRWGGPLGGRPKAKVVLSETLHLGRSIWDAAPGTLFRRNDVDSRFTDPHLESLQDEPAPSPGSDLLGRGGTGRDGCSRG